MVRIWMRPTCTVPMTQLFLLLCQHLPVVQGIRLLDHPHKRRQLAFTFLLADFNHFGQAATEVITTVANVKLGPNVDHVALAQVWNPSGVALGLKLAKAGFTGVGLFGGREGALRFGACVVRGHFPIKTLNWT